MLQNSTTKEASLVAAQEKFKICKNELYATLCEEQLKLLKYQRTLEEKFHREFVNGSLQDTLVNLLALGEVKLADKLRAEYKVPDRRWDNQQNRTFIIVIFDLAYYVSSDERAKQAISAYLCINKINVPCVSVTVIATKCLD